MNYLYLLRHAEAAPAGLLESDIDRPLTLHGQDQARDAGAYLRDGKFDVSKVICSPALRTRETLNGLLSGRGSQQQPAIHIMEELYDAFVQTLLETARKSGPGTLLVAHNPGIHELAFTLTHDQRLDRAYSPATLSVISYEDVLQPGFCTLEGLFVPA